LVECDQLFAESWIEHQKALEIALEIFCGSWAKSGTQLPRPLLLRKYSYKIIVRSKYQCAMDDTESGAKSEFKKQ
jgi:hypothetical protein